MWPQLLLKNIVLHSKKGIVRGQIALFSMRRKCKSRSRLSKLRLKRARREILKVSLRRPLPPKDKLGRVKINPQQPLPQGCVTNVVLPLIYQWIANLGVCVIIARNLVTSNRSVGRKCMMIPEQRLLMLLTRTCPR